jgi:hypothetical protein
VFLLSGLETSAKDKTVGVVVPFGRGDRKASLDPLMELVARDMERVNEAILVRAHSDLDLIPKLAGHLIASGGKRLRPMLTIAAARMCGYDGDAHVKLATAVEFMHTATLLHDDVVDESEVRRGKAAARLLWGNQASVLVGDYLLGQAFKMMVETGSLDALRVLANAAALIAEGEVLQLATTHDTSTTEDGYLRVIAAKTAPLFAAAAEVGGIIAERPRGRAGGARFLRPQPRGRVPAGRRRAGLFRQAGADGQDRRRRFPRGQDHATGGAGLSPRQRRGTRLLETDAGRRRTVSPTTSIGRSSSWPATRPSRTRWSAPATTPSSRGTRWPSSPTPATARRSSRRSSSA